MFCEICGNKLIKKPLLNEGIIPFCNSCDEFRFPKYNVAISMIVIDKSTKRILLIRQYGRPDLILVAGYVNRGESLEDAAYRELMEETGLLASEIRYNRSSFFEPSDTLMCNFTVLVDDTKGFSPNNEIDSFEWFGSRDARENIKPDSLAESFLVRYLDEKKEDW